MLKAIGTGVLLTLFTVALAYGLWIVIRNIIDCLPNPDDEDE